MHIAHAPLFMAHTLERVSETTRVNWEASLSLRGKLAGSLALSGPERSRRQSQYRPIGPVVAQGAYGDRLSRKQAPSVNSAILLETLRHNRHIAFMLIETEKTPNPATLKFLPGRPVMTAGTRDFASPEEAEASPLAEALFTLSDVTGVFFGAEFISVTIAPGGDWGNTKPDVLSILLDHFSADMPLFRAGSAAGISVPAEDGGAAFHDDPADSEIIEQIRELIDTRVRPAVANDGGDIVYRGFDKGKVYLRMQGACAGCPSSSATLKNGIEQLLKHYVPEVTEVLAV